MFVNRIDEIVLFQALGLAELCEITELLLQRTSAQLLAQGVRLKVSERAVRWLARRGHQPEFGARPLRRMIQRELDNRLAQLVLDGVLPSGSRVLVDARAEELTLEVAPEFDSTLGRHAAWVAVDDSVLG